MVRFATILVGVALDARDRFLIETCAALVAPLGARHVVLAHVRRLDPPLAVLGVTAPDAPGPDPREGLAALAEALRARLPSCAVTTARGVGSPAEELLAIGEREEADLLLLGRRAGPGCRPDEGLDGRAMLRHAACTTLVVPEGCPFSPGHALVGLDLSPGSLRALAVAAGLFARVTPALCLPEEQGATAAKAEQEARERFEREARPALPPGARVADLALLACDDPAEALLAWVAEHAPDAVVLGGHSRSRLAAALLGSTAERVAREAPVPVLVARDRHVRRGLLRSLVQR